MDTISIDYADELQALADNGTATEEQLALLDTYNEVAYRESLYDTVED
jgi:hypothetical protein